MYQFIAGLAERIIDGEEITVDEAISLSEVEGSDILLLMGYAGKLRDHFKGNRVEMCSIISAKTGNCSENCKFCSQSSHYLTGVEFHDMMKEDEIVKKAKAMEKAGADRFDIVISGLGVHHQDPDFQKIIRAIKRIKQETNLEMCACLGTLTKEAAKELALAGVTRYNHNLQTSRNFFDNVITSHDYKDRVETIRIIHESGMEACCGGIIGMGENWRDRIEFAFELKSLNVETIPLNFLNAIPGTPLESVKSLNPIEILKTIAIFRFILPDKILRYAGGREKCLGEFQVFGLMSGIDALLTGNYLTTSGQKINDDQSLIQRAGLKSS